MDNHFHLLILDKEDNLTAFMRSVAVAYAMHYNVVYNHVGHVFQDRFISEPIEDDQYALSVLRYILNNPKKAGIKKGRALKMTSEDSYFGDARYNAVDAEFVLNQFGSRGDFESAPRT
jgi:REP element-mobilizing transposase RayT